MGKGKKPRKPQPPAPDTSAAGEEEFERQTEAKSELVPPSRRPPTAVGAETPAPPPREPPHSRPAPVPERSRPALFRLLQAIRGAVGAVLDLADAAADVITKRREGQV